MTTKQKKICKKKNLFLVFTLSFLHHTVSVPKRCLYKLLLMSECDICNIHSIGNIWLQICFRIWNKIFFWRCKNFYNNNKTDLCSIALVSAFSSKNIEFQQFQPSQQRRNIKKNTGNNFKCHPNCIYKRIKWTKRIKSWKGIQILYTLTSDNLGTKEVE